MYQTAQLARLFSSVSQAVIGTDGAKIIFANPAANAAAGYDLEGRSAEETLPAEILAGNADSYICAATIFGRNASISVIKEGPVFLLFVDFINDGKSALYITRHIISNLRNNAMGLKMSADRCFSLLEDGKSPSEKNISVLYHYYYCLLRTLTQVDSADLIERGTLLFTPVATELVKLCSELCDTVSSLCSKNDVKISFSTDETELIAAVDPSKIEQLLLNLFANSLQHTVSGNSITLSLHRSGNKIVFSLDDDGSGIPQEMLSNIFKLPDDNDDPSVRRSGNGLGLFISFGIVQLHKGVFLIESREGEGTHVRVMLPADESPAPKFSSPDPTYRHSGASFVLTELADVLPSDRFGLKYED